MSQGNPFGNRGGDWMPDAALRALLATGATYAQIAGANEAITGWRPHKSSVTRKREALGINGRNAAHCQLIPWEVRPEHNSHVFRHMLQAESRRRQQIPQSDSDKVLTGRLAEVLDHDRMVITYYPDTAEGFAAVRREPSDKDIIRAPAEGAVLRRELRGKKGETT